jgi:hypothetical protein
MSLPYRMREQAVQTYELRDFCMYVLCAMSKLQRCAYRGVVGGE